MKIRFDLALARTRDSMVIPFVIFGANETGISFQKTFLLVEC